MVTGRSKNPRDPHAVKTSKSAPKTVNRMITLSLYPMDLSYRSVVLISFEKILSLSPLIILCFRVSADNYFIHLQPETLGVNVIPSTFGKPLRHKNLPTQRKGKLQREVVEPRFFSKSLNKTTSQMSKLEILENYMLLDTTN